MTTLTNSAQSGLSSGTQVTAANSGQGNAGSAFDVVTIGTSATLNFDNTQSPHGGLSYVFATTATSASSLLQWSTSMGSQPQVWFVLYGFFSALPSTNINLWRAQQSATLCGGLRLLSTTGKLIMIDSAGATQATTANAIPLGSWFRVEGFVLGSATVGQVEVRLFQNQDAPSTTDVQTSAATLNTTGNADTFRYGLTVGAASVSSFWLGSNLGLSSTGYIGPYIVSSAIPIAPGKAWLRQFRHPQVLLPSPAVAATSSPTVPPVQVRTYKPVSHFALRGRLPVQQSPIPAPNGYPLPLYPVSQRSPSLRPTEFTTRPIRAKQFPIAAPNGFPLPQYSPSQRRPSLRQAAMVATRPVRAKQQMPISAPSGQPLPIYPQPAIRAKIPQAAMRRQKVPLQASGPLPALTQVPRRRTWVFDLRPKRTQPRWLYLQTSGPPPALGRPVRVTAKASMPRAARYALPPAIVLVPSPIRRVNRAAAMRLGRPVGLAPVVVAAQAPPVPATAVRAKILQYATRPIRAKQMPIAAPQGYPLPQYSTSQRRPAARLAAFLTARHQAQKAPPVVTQAVVPVLTSARAKPTSAAVRLTPRRPQAPQLPVVPPMSGSRSRTTAPRLVRTRGLGSPLAQLGVGRVISRIAGVRSIRVSRRPNVVLPAVVPPVGPTLRARLWEWLGRRPIMRQIFGAPPPAALPPLGQGAGGTAFANQPGGTANSPTPGGSASLAQSSGSVTQPLPGGSVTEGSPGGTVS